jgi:hypothetical protein
VNGYSIDDVIIVMEDKLAEHGVDPDEYMTHSKLRYEYEFSAGVDAIFIKLDDTTGFKFYSSEEKAESCYVKQAYAHGKGIAPFAGEFVRFDWRSRGWYGFFTQVAQVGSDVHGADGLGDSDEHTDLINEAADMLRSVGFQDEDMHMGNFGYIDGRMVVIDFSFSDATNADMDYHELKDQLLAA